MRRPSGIKRRTLSKADNENGLVYMTVIPKVPLSCSGTFFFLTKHINICQYVYMRSITETFKLLTDELRVRILMLLSRKELSVCQVMGITGASQPLVSRNLALLYRGGFLDERRDGKLRFYRISKDLSGNRKAIIDLVHAQVKSAPKYREDIETLKECSEFQKRAGKCDMKTLQEFMKWKEKRRRENE